MFSLLIPAFYILQWTYNCMYIFKNSPKGDDVPWGPSRVSSWEKLSGGSLKSRILGGEATERERSCSREGGVKAHLPAQRLGPHNSLPKPTADEDAPQDSWQGRSPGSFGLDHCLNGTDLDGSNQKLPKRMILSCLLCFHLPVLFPKQCRGPEGSSRTALPGVPMEAHTYMSETLKKSKPSWQTVQSNMLWVPSTLTHMLCHCLDFRILPPGSMSEQSLSPGLPLLSYLIASHTCRHITCVHADAPSH